MISSCFFLFRTELHGWNNNRVDWNYTGVDRNNRAWTFWRVYITWRLFRAFTYEYYRKHCRFKTSSWMWRKPIRMQHRHMSPPTLGLWPRCGLFWWRRRIGKNVIGDYPPIYFLTKIQAFCDFWCYVCFANGSNGSAMYCPWMLYFVSRERCRWQLVIVHLIVVSADIIAINVHTLDRCTWFSWDKQERRNNKSRKMFWN